MKITLEISDRNEATDAPYWLIINPIQMMRPDPYLVSEMVSGPFFSRESAQTYLDSHRYNFTDRAVVYCASGHRSREYREAIREARSEDFRRVP